jgi:hypothetical protein
MRYVRCAFFLPRLTLQAIAEGWGWRQPVETGVSGVAVVRQ